MPSDDYLQLNKCETGPYFLQNFQCTIMFISAYCKIFELNTEHESVFAADVSGVSLKVSCKFWTILGSHNMGSQLLQNTEINIVVHWKFWRKYGPVSHLFSCTNCFGWVRFFRRVKILLVRFKLDFSGLIFIIWTCSKWFGPNKNKLDPSRMIWTVQIGPIGQGRNA